MLLGDLHADQKVVFESVRHSVREASIDSPFRSSLTKIHQAIVMRV
jgi:hypothetical protein